MICSYIISSYLFFILLVFINQINKLQLVEIPFNKEEEESNELATMEPEQLQELDPKQLEYQLTVLQDRLQESKPNLAVIQEYRKKVRTACFKEYSVIFRGILELLSNKILNGVMCICESCLHIRLYITNQNEGSVVTCLTWLC